MLTAALIADRNENFWENYTTEFIYGDRKQRLLEDYQNLYIYDRNGNLTSKQSKTLSGEVTNYIYNSSNQLEEVQFYKDIDLVKKVIYGYTALGHRIEKEVIDYEEGNNSFTRRYIYNGESILAEYDDNNRILASYTHSPFGIDDILSANITSDGVIAQVGKKTGSFFYIKDAIGNVIDIVDHNGVKMQHHIYSVFGKLLKLEDSNGNDITNAPVFAPYFSFTGREYDRETGLYYYRARYYDSSTGRFLSVDPYDGILKQPFSLVNKFIYALNNPLAFTDPSGKFINVHGDYCGYTANGKPVYDEYGNQIGKTEPIDELDEACRKHDEAYAINIPGIIEAGDNNSAINLNFEDSWGRVKRDLGLVVEGTEYFLENILKEPDKAIIHGAGVALFGACVFGVYSRRMMLLSIPYSVLEWIF